MIQLKQVFILIKIGIYKKYTVFFLVFVLYIGSKIMIEELIENLGAFSRKFFSMQAESNTSTKLDKDAPPLVRGQWMDAKGF